MFNEFEFDLIPAIYAVVLSGSRAKQKRVDTHS